MHISILILGIWLSAFANAAPVSRQINISTEIDKNKFSSGEFMDVRFVPDSLTAVFDNNRGTFNDLNTNLSVVTNLPISEANSGFSIQLNENDMVCLNGRGEIVNLTSSQDVEVYGFAKFSVDGTSIPIGKSIRISRFNVINNGVFEGYYPVNMNFHALSSSNLNDGKCSGNISVRVEFNI